MVRKEFLVYTAAVLLTVAGISGLRADDAKEATARKAAEAWLKLVDQGEYGTSWDEAGSYFKGAVGREQWEKQVGSARKPLGTVKDRKLADAQYTKQLPGAPDGEYVVIQYQVSFENKQSAIETVTPTLDKDGQWRVVGYFVR